MNIAELKKILDAENFDPRAYSLEGGQDHDRLCISDERSRWCVYYSERGSRFSENCYPTEDEACRNLLERLRRLSDGQAKLK